MTTGVVCCEKLAAQAGAGGLQSGGIFLGDGVSETSPRCSLGSLLMTKFQRESV
jgi:hypothetical protein